MSEVSKTAITDTIPSDNRDEVQICALPQLQTDLCCLMDAVIKDTVKTKCIISVSAPATDLRSWSLPVSSFKSFNKTQFYIFIKILSLSPCFILYFDV